MMGYFALLMTVLIGLFSGMAMGLTGSSGVLIVVPLLNLLLNFSIHESIGTSLLVDIMASLAVSYTYYRHGNMNVKSGIWVAIGSVLGAQLGTLFAFGMPEAGLGGAFGIFLIVVGVLMWKKGLSREAIASRVKGIVRFENRNQQIAVAGILGLIVGINTGIFGAGGGIWILLILIFVLNLSLHEAIGTSTLMMAITACSGAIGYASHASLSLRGGLVVGFGAAVGGIASARFANKSTERALTKVVSGLFVFLGVVMTILRLI
ncbi:MAG: sulfite exporter TauE/SafE family protein [Candidatus Bathyarchaeia archaeon]